MRATAALAGSLSLLVVGLWLSGRAAEPRFPPRGASHEALASANEPTQESFGAEAPAPHTTSIAPSHHEPPFAPGEPTASENETLARVREIEAAVAREDTRQLPRLRARALRDDPEAAAPLVRAVGYLAALAPAEEKRAAAETLGRWLAEEMAEDSTFARGNVSLLLDALADTGSQSAVLPLVRALDAGTLPLHQATKAVEALGALGDPRGAEAVARFAAGLEAPTAALDPALRDEARAAARATLSQLSPG